MSDVFTGLPEDELRRRFPRSAAYPKDWVVKHSMGPHVLWLTEELTGQMQFERGMRVLDLGCGRALSSIFLAQQFDVQVWAADLWIKPTENLARIREAGVPDQVYPISMEAHTLPFAEGFFDAIVSVDAYHYFGTDDLYLSYLAKFLRPGGQIGIVVPAVRGELEGEPPAHLVDVWDPDYYSFHSPEWWAKHWDRTGLMATVDAAWVADGARLWKAWEDMWTPSRTSPVDTELLDADAGRLLGFARMVGRKKE